MLRETPTSSSSSIDHLPSHDAWINVYHRLLPQWKSFIHSSQPLIPILIARDNQVDAKIFDVKMSAMLKEQLVKVFNLVKDSYFNIKPKLDAFLKFLI